MVFISDLKLGQLYEEKYINKKGIKNIHYPKDKAFKDYDFKNLTNDVAYEVKADRMTCKTGYIFIEFMCSGVKSGITATKADYWVHYVCKENNPTEAMYYYKIPVCDLKEFIEDDKYYRKVNGGDSGRASGYLFDEDVFEDFRKRV